MQPPPVYIWKKAPFLRLIIPFIAGIILQWYLPRPLALWIYLLGGSTLALVATFYLPLFSRYRLNHLNGIIIHILFFSLGAGFAWKNDIRNNQNWLGNRYETNDRLIVTLQEPPVEKTNSYKIIAKATYINKNDHYLTVTGNLIIYLQKNKNSKELKYGNQIAFSKNLQEIKNAGNPGGFDYKRYCLFQGITHQVYLKDGDYIVLPGSQKAWLNTFLFSIRADVLTIIRNFIPGNKEAGLAEALLIGYKDDLDKNLVQSYSNTGVVHVIAISGLHLGLIYWLLLLLMKPLKQRKKFKWITPVVVILCLWLFSLITGAQPSVLRSAVMFTCIVAGENFLRKASIFNTLALSAFLLLCYNPFWLWDVGFQLSYAAVISIVIFLKPIYNWFYFENKILDAIWKLNAVTLAAQIFTIPISIYHFHQFPNLFLLTNALAVPLSSIILLGEILLISLSFVSFLAKITGVILSWLISLLNNFIERIDALPFAIWDNLTISFWQMLFLFIAIFGCSLWLMEKRKTGILTACLALILFFTLRDYSYYQTREQQKLIVYNVPRYPAIDIIDGNKSLFIGDTILLQNDFIRNFHLKPSRNLFRISNIIFNNQEGLRFFEYNHKKIMLVNTTFNLRPFANRLPIDLMVVSGNPKLYFQSINKTFNIKQVIFDGSVPAYKLKYWKKDCSLLHISFHDVTEQGAFVMNLN
ncbi:MAG TPA: ComEC/Rec2 family competence protein [Chitinophagaceae bacterium]